jgi:hypothetical protein
MQACWAILAEATGRVTEAAAAVRSVARPCGTLAEVRSHYEEETRILLAEPVDHFLRLRPVRRSLEAMQECDQETARGKLRSRARIDARFQRLLAEASLELCEPWRIRRSGDQEDEWKDWELRRTAQAKRAVELLAKYEKWAQSSAEPGAGPGEDQRREKRFESWWRQNRAITALLEVEVSLRTLSLRWLDGTAELIAGLHQERTEITGLTARMAQWVRDGANENEPVPGVTLRTTVIVGYPGETAEDFAELQAFVKSVEFDHLGVFTYSHEEGTSAHDLADDVPASTKERRRGSLMSLQGRIVARTHRARVGRQVRLLVDGPSAEHELVLRALTAGQAPDIDPLVYLTDCDPSAVAPGQFLDAEIVASQGYDLLARPLAVAEPA